MASSGSGTGTPVSTPPGGFYDLFQTWPVSALPLARLARYLGIPEPPFYGVAHPDNPRWACREIWTKFQRDQVAFFLAEAQETLEAHLNYPIAPRWIIEEHPVRPVLLTRLGMLLSLGQRAESVIQANAPVNHTNDPATVGPIATTVTDTREVKIFYPGTGQEIEANKVLISGGFLTIWINRVRMVEASRLDNPATGLDYHDLDNFQAAVDVRRIYNDPALTAELAWTKHDCAPDCEEVTTSACALIENAEVGRVSIAATGDQSAAYGAVPVKARIYYRAGMNKLSGDLEDVLIRLTNSKIPEELCGCANAGMIWKRDQMRPEMLSRERMACPFGTSDGAWYAWTRAQALALVRMRGI